MPPPCHITKSCYIGTLPGKGVQSGHWDGGQFQLGLAYRVCLVAVYLAVVHVEDAIVVDATPLPN